jgi:hypothetical protein
MLLERRVDSKTNNRIKNSITSGFTIIQYPKYQIQELLAIKLSKEILESLFDSEYFFDKNGNKKAIKTENVNIGKLAKDSFENILKKGYEHLDGIKVADGKLIQESFKSDVDLMLNKRHGLQSNSAFYYSLFKTASTGNYFDLINSNKSTLRDKWIEEIYEYVTLITKEYRNLRIVDLVLDIIIEYITTVTKFYKDEYSLNGLDNTWDKILQKQINEYKSDELLNKIYFTEREAINYYFKQTAELCKIHIGISMLEQIKDELQYGKMNLKSISGKELPSKSKIRNVVNSLEMIAHGIGDSNTYTLNQRESELYSILNANNSCFKMLYVSGSKENDLDNAYNSYKRSIDLRLSVYKLFDTDNVWQYLNGSNIDLYSTSLKNALGFVRANNFVGEADLIQIILNIEPSSSNRSIRDLFLKEKDLIKSDHVPPMMPIDNTRNRFDNDASAKLMFISNSHNEINNKLLANKNYTLDPGISGSNAVDISDLNNTIVIYQEYGYMGDSNGIKQTFEPLNHISYMEITKEHLRRVVSEDFKLKKVPYLTLEEFKSYIK